MAAGKHCGRDSYPKASLQMHGNRPARLCCLPLPSPPRAGSETPSRTSWGHFFVKDSARHPLILEAEAQIEALFNSAAVRGGYGPLAKVEALQGERAAHAARRA